MHTQYRQCEEIVRKIQWILGAFAGYRTLHADGRLYRGSFTGNSQGRRYTRARHLQGSRVPVTVRFSLGGSDPCAHIGISLGMATRFYLPDGMFTHLVMLNHKVFVASTVEQFRALLDAMMPAEPADPIAHPATGRQQRSDADGLERFLAANPNVAAALRLRADSPAPLSFAHTEFSAVHVFLFRNSANVVTPARCHWTPVAGVRGQRASHFAQNGLDSLFAELEDRLENAAVEFDLQLELAEEGDPLDDATAIWSPDRRRVAIGRLSLERAVSEMDVGDLVMKHDPTALLDGIDATDDPILQIRRGIYEVSAAQRSGGWHRK